MYPCFRSIVKMKMKIIFFASAIAMHCLVQTNAKAQGVLDGVYVKEPGSFSK